MSLILNVSIYFLFSKKAFFKKGGEIFPCGYYKGAGEGGSDTLKRVNISNSYPPTNLASLIWIRNMVLHVMVWSKYVFKGKRGKNGVHYIFKKGLMLIKGLVDRLRWGLYYVQ